MLNQRHVYYLFRLKTGINKSQLEILVFANSIVSFNAYQIQMHFKQMNLQQVRTSIKKLVDISAIERLNPGAKNKPATYIINNYGKFLLSDYYELWYAFVMPNA